MTSRQWLQTLCSRGQAIFFKIAFLKAVPPKWTKLLNRFLEKLIFNNVLEMLPALNLRRIERYKISNKNKYL